MSSGNFLFYLLILLGPLVAMSSSRWLICWVGIELRFLGVIPILLSRENLRLRKEATIKYFCIQALGRGLLLCGGLFYFGLSLDIGVVSEIFFALRLIIKLGVFPAHFWVPRVVSGLNWFPIFIILTWQKIPPFLFLSLIASGRDWVCDLLLLLGGARALVGGFIGLNQRKLRVILGASSISHRGWVVIGTVYGSLWFYFIIYCFSLFVLIYFLNQKDYFFSGLCIISLRGLPPFIIFLGKWSVLKCALGLGYSYWFLLLPLLGSLIRLFFYLKFFYSFYLEEDLVGLKKLINFRFGGILLFIGVIYISFF